MVYFIVQGDEYVKIGYCNKDPLGRFQNLQPGNPHKLFLVMLIEGRKEYEKEIQEGFKRYHFRGEWFYLSHEIESWMSENSHFCVLGKYKTSVPKYSGQRSCTRKGVWGVHKWAA